MSTDTASHNTAAVMSYGREPQVLVATQRTIATAFALAVGISIVIGVISYLSVSRLRDDSAEVAHTQEVIGALQTLLSTVTDAQTASRGYAITGSETFLQPYNEAVRVVDVEVARLRSLTADNASQEQRLKAVTGLLEQRMGFSAEVIAARRVRGFDGARELVASGRGERVQDGIRRIVEEMTNAERTLLTERQARTHDSSTAAMHIVFAGSLLAFGVVLAALVLVRRDFAGARRAEGALREANGVLGLRVAERTAELTRVNEHLTSAYQELRLLVEQAPLAIAMFDRDMCYIAVSRRWVSEYGRGRSELRGLSHYEVHPDIPQSWVEVHRRGFAGEFIKHDDDIWVQADGSKHWLRWAVSPWRNEKGDIGGITIFAEDITQRKHAEDRLRLADAVFRNTQEGIVVTDLGANIVAVNPAFSTITEYSEAELLGQHMRLLQSGRQGRGFYQNMWESILAEGSWQGEIWDRRKGGEIHQQWVQINTVRDDSGEPTNYVGVFTDISRMHHAQTHLEYLAHHDVLTGLPNRSLLYSRLRHTLERARRDGTLCAVLLVDLDGFKAVNDTLGHEAGDELLQLAGDRMRQRLRDSDTLARLGGDEFVVVLDHLSAPEDVAQMARALIEQLSIPFQLAHGNEINIGASAGISLFPVSGDDAESLVRSADVALYRAKAAGRGTWRFDGLES